MPPTLFIPAAFELGLDVTQLKDEFDDTFAGVARQLRDYVLPDQPLYITRCHVEKAPERRCPKLMATLEASKGVCVRIEDIIHTSRISRCKRRGWHWKDGDLPYYHVPNKLEWRIMPPEVRRAIENETPLFLKGINGQSWFGHSMPDLLGEYELSVLITPFRTRYEKGILIIALHPTQEHLIATQLKHPQVITRDDVYWLFSRDFDKARRRKCLPVESGVAPNDPSGIALDGILAEYDDDGEVTYSLDRPDKDEEYKWMPHITPKSRIRKPRPK